MKETPDQTGDARKEINQSLVLGVAVGQVGCLTLIIVLAALFGGLWLDQQLNTKPILTIVLMIASVPVTLIAMFWIVRKATARLQNNRKVTTRKQIVEEISSGSKEEK